MSNFGTVAIKGPSVCVIGGKSQKHSVVLSIDSASKHFTSDVYIFQAFSRENAANALFSNAAGTNIMSRTAGTVKFKACDNAGNQRIVTLHDVYHVPQQQRSRVVVCQVTHSAEESWESLDFKKCMWNIAQGVLFPFD